MSKAPSLIATQQSHASPAPTAGISGRMALLCLYGEVQMENEGTQIDTGDRNVRQVTYLREPEDSTPERQYSHGVTRFCDEMGDGTWVVTWDYTDDPLTTKEP